MATIEDLARSHTVSFINRETELVRVFHINELTADPEGQLLEAIQHPTIPAMGAQHPVATALFVVRKSANPAGENGAYVECTYSNSSGSTWNQPTPETDGEDVKQVSSSLITRRQTVDRLGAPMEMTTPPSYQGPIPDSRNYLSEAQVFRPVGTIVFERSESNPPTARARQLLNTVNNANLGTGDLYPQGTLLFARFNSESVDGGRVWRSVYEFRYDPEGWIHRDTWKTDSGKVPVDAVEQTFELYAQGNFGSLGLNWDDDQTPI